jgi:hypothetical protein
MNRLVCGVLFSLKSLFPASGFLNVCLTPITMLSFLVVAFKIKIKYQNYASGKNV